ncbi:MAG TPA: ion channel [Candidatus Binataceae bacterium]|nr:ion channel [Candidatus Binataceae bacterium]
MNSSTDIALLRPLVVGVAITLGTILIHGLALGAIVTVVRRDLQRGVIGGRFVTDLIFVTAALMLAFAAHLLEIALWALVILRLGEFSSFATSFYYSAGAYTTVGSGILMSARWKLLAPLEGADGMLMFGISTAIIFAVIQRLVEARYGIAENSAWE